MDIDIVGEDPVTQAIIERLISDYRPDMNIARRLPARGSEIKNLAPKYNLLDTPVFLLTDLDAYHCPPALIKDWFPNTELVGNFLFRIAQEEAETWLMADREGFSAWLNVDVNLIPHPQIIDKKRGSVEIICPLKPSLFMMRNVAAATSNHSLKEYLTPIAGAKKGPGYNLAMIPFIKNIWDVENAAINSYSLSKAISRLQSFQI